MIEFLQSDLGAILWLLSLPTLLILLMWVYGWFKPWH
jgi:hypothetical protein